MAKLLLHVDITDVTSWDRVEGVVLPRSLGIAGANVDSTAGTDVRASAEGDARDLPPKLDFGGRVGVVMLPPNVVVSITGVTLSGLREVPGLKGQGSCTEVASLAVGLAPFAYER